MLDKWARSSTQAANELQVRSVVNPLLWLTAIVLPGCLIGTYFLDEFWVQVVLLTLVVLVVLADLAAYAFFALRDPGKLQSEEFQLRMVSLQMMQSREGVETIPTDPSRAIPNPALPHLPGEAE